MISGRELAFPKKEEVRMLKKTCTVLILICMLLIPSSVLGANVADVVQLIVEVHDNDKLLEDRISSFIRRELRSLGDIETEKHIVLHILVLSRPPDIELLKRWIPIAYLCMYTDLELYKLSGISAHVDHLKSMCEAIVADLDSCLIEPLRKKEVRK
jgi:hypothetical protein